MFVSLYLFTYIVFYCPAIVQQTRTTLYMLTSTSHNSIPNNSGQEWGVPTALKQLFGGGKGYLHDRSEQQNSIMNV